MAGPEGWWPRCFGATEDDFIYPADRSERYVVIEVSMFEGRSPEARKALIGAFYRWIPEATGIQPHDIEITLFETPRSAWGIRGLPGDEIGLNYKVDV
ncbi:MULTISPECIES: tautomerase family protein [Roseomonadaceae]|uniref:tautomerase family protein n=1 Tax=Roseomonadaceae TaxID=3385906 RepID=UPI002E762CA2|nr:tautomerase family protein [Roseomonas oleicola]